MQGAGNLKLILKNIGKFTSKFEISIICSDFINNVPSIYIFIKP